MPEEPQGAPDATEAPFIDGEFQLIRVPVFAAGELNELKDALSDLSAAQTRADAALLAINNSLRLAYSIDDRSKRPHWRTPQPIKPNKPNALSPGPARVLVTLAGMDVSSVSRASLAILLEIADSTLRTYLPILREAELIYTGDNGLVAITNKGRNAARELSSSVTSQP